MKRRIIAVCVVVILAVGVSWRIVTADDREVKLKSRLAYLMDIPEVAWVEIEGNNVYVGFKTRPNDLQLIIGSAAALGNRAINFGVHVWAVPADRGWRPGSPGPWSGVTARYGKVQKYWGNW